MVAVQEEQKNVSTKLYQGIGLICGKVVFDEEDNTTVIIEGEEFRLTCFRFAKERLKRYLAEIPIL